MVENRTVFHLSHAEVLTHILMCIQNMIQTKNSLMSPEMRFLHNGFLGLTCYYKFPSEKNYAFIVSPLIDLLKRMVSCGMRKP